MNKEHPALSDASKMCTLLAEARHRQVKNSWQGDSHGYHPCGLLVDDILFINEWNSNNYCNISIATIRGTDWIDPYFGRNASVSHHHNALPKPKEGKLVQVWSNGVWDLEGPWQEKINDFLLRVSEEILDKRDGEYARIVEREDSRRKTQEEERGKLIKDWTDT